jgi:hypothetical protein
MDRERDTLATVELFGSWGIATFPGPYGEKGTRIPTWPDIPAKLAGHLTTLYLSGVVPWADEEAERWFNDLNDEDQRKARNAWKRAGQESNICARTGRTAGGAWYAVIDLDGKCGIEPGQALHRLLKALPEGVPVVKTARGFQLHMLAKRPLGNGDLPDYGGELFSDSHLVNLPPSRHPAGVDYQWVMEPGGYLP